MTTSPTLVLAHRPPGGAAPSIDSVGRAPRTAPPTRHPVPRRRSGERGQATAEYALVLLGAAAIALLLAAWAAQSGQIGRLFDVVVGQLIDRAG